MWLQGAVAFMKQFPWVLFVSGDRQDSAQSFHLITTTTSAMWNQNVSGARRLD
ncbi:hypothetical protein SynWH8103_01478 [Synechococcus sp. WH 8103]|nr:hypothetical protein SynWH8103_01478 [Synechococcus sp. WH 8103]